MKGCDEGMIRTQHHGGGRSRIEGEWHSAWRTSTIVLAKVFYSIIGFSPSELFGVPLSAGLDISQLSHPESRDEMKLRFTCHGET
jgi:hypothetical protein